MPTPAQLEANRANSQKSNGPRTPEGKARSAQNAFDHGLCGRDIFLLPGEEDEFNELQTGLYEQILPKGTLEDELFKALVHAAWNQRRCRRAEADLQKKAAEKGLDPLLDPTFDADVRRVDLYARRASSALHKNMKALRDLQTERHTRQIFAAECPIAPDPARFGLAKLVAVRSGFLKVSPDPRRASIEQLKALHDAIDLEPALFAARRQRNNAAACTNKPNSPNAP